MVVVFVNNGDKDIARVLEEAGIEYKLAMLSFGSIHIQIGEDYFIFHRLNVKTLLDHVFKRTLNTLLYKLESFKNPFILLELKGTLKNKYRKLFFTKITQLVFNPKIKVIPIGDVNDIPAVVKFFMDIGKDEMNATLKRPKPKYETMSVKEWQIYVLSGFPGIGMKKAKKLLEKYGNLKEVLQAILDGREKLDQKTEEVLEASF